MSPEKRPRRSPAPQKRVVMLELLVVTSAPLKSLTAARLVVELRHDRQGDTELEALPLIAAEARAAEIVAPKR
jgi:hypothetical protein